MPDLPVDVHIEIAKHWVQQAVDPLEPLGSAFCQSICRVLDGRGDTDCLKRRHFRLRIESFDRLYYYVSHPRRFKHWVDYRMLEPAMHHTMLSFYNGKTVVYSIKREYNAEDGFCSETIHTKQAVWATFLSVYIWVDGRYLSTSVCNSYDLTK